MDNLQEELPRSRIEDEDGAVCSELYKYIIRIQIRTELTDRFGRQVALKCLVTEKWELVTPDMILLPRNAHSNSVHIRIIHEP
jgi:hypothetical protein